MSFPNFPAFRKLTLADEKAYLAYYSQLKRPSSDLSFDNAMTWLNYNDDLEGCSLNGNLIIKFTDVLTNNTPCYSIVGLSKTRTTMERLFGFLTTQSTRPQLSYVPDELVDILKKLNLPGLVIQEEVSNNDYVYTAADLAEMRGKKYRNLRERVIKFSSNKNINVQVLNCRDNTTKELIVSSITTWSAQEDVAKQTELAIIKKYLNLADSLPLQALGLFVNTHLVCVTIFHSPPQEGWLIGEHLKYNPSFPGVYGYAVHQLALFARARGVKFLNCEQDLGIEGLRFIKTILRPSEFLRSYTVSFESGVKYQ